MEIFIKDNNSQQKVNWFSSIPEKYRNEILDRLKQDKLKLDDPACSQYQIVLDLMGKDDTQLFKEREEKLLKQEQELLLHEYEEKKSLEDGQASAYLIREGSIYDPDRKQLLFTVPEHQKPRFLSKTNLLSQILMKEAEQMELGGASEDNQFIFEEIMKNEIIREEFEMIREMYGNEAYELNKMSLLSFIKQGKHHFTYSVKYYGIDEGQIGILSRKVPFDDQIKRDIKSFRLPRMCQPLPRLPKIGGQDQYELVEVEYSEDEYVTVEVELSSDEEDAPLPKAVKPQASIDVLQGSVGGNEFAAHQRDSKPVDTLGDDEEIVADKQQTLIMTSKPKKTKLVQEKRRVKKKKLVRKLKVPDESERTFDSSPMKPFHEEQPSQPTTAQEVMGVHASVQARQRSQPDRSLNPFKQNPGQGQPGKIPQFLSTEDRQHIEQLESAIDQSIPFMINFRDLFKKCELHNLKEFKQPEPEKYDQHIVHQYSLPKGLHALKRTEILSEAEKLDKERYSKRNIQLHMIDKEYQKMNLGGQSYGLKGSKVKPIYFPFSHTSASAALGNALTLSTSQSASMLFQTTVGNANTTVQQLATVPVKPLPKQLPNFKQLNISNKKNGPNKICVKDAALQRQPIQGGSSAEESIIKTGISQNNKSLADEILQQREQQDHVDIKNQNVLGGNYLNEEDPSMATGDIDPETRQPLADKSKLPFLLNSSEISHIQGSILKPLGGIQGNPLTGTIATNASIHLFDKNISQSTTMNLQINQQQQISMLNKPSVKVAKKNNQIIKNLARNKKSDALSPQDEKQSLGGVMFGGVQGPSAFANPISEQFYSKQMPRNASHQQFGFKISNQMKASYLTDTRKLLDKQSRKVNKQQRPSFNNQDLPGDSSGNEDEAEDQLIFNEPLAQSKKVQLPLIKNSSMPNLAKPIVDSEREVYLKYLKAKNDIESASHTEGFRGSRGHTGASSKGAF